MAKAGKKRSEKYDGSFEDVIKVFVIPQTEPKKEKKPTKKK